MITYAEVKSSPTPKEAYMSHEKDFELQISEFIDGRRKNTHKDVVVNALRTQADLVARDDEWPSQVGTDMKPMYVPAEQQPTESEMKNAAAARQAAEMAEQREIESSYTEDPQINPQSDSEHEQAEQRKKREDEILGSDKEREAEKRKPGATTTSPLTGKDTPKTA